MIETYEHICAHCEAQWIDHVWTPRCPQCSSDTVTNWPIDSGASHEAQDLARMWSGVYVDAGWKGIVDV